MINKQNKDEICEFVASKIIGYEIAFTREGDVVTKNSEGRWAIMPRNMLMSILRNDLKQNFKELQSNKEINKLLNIIIKNFMELAQETEQGEYHEVQHKLS